MLFLFFVAQCKMIFYSKMGKKSVAVYNVPRILPICAFWWIMARIKCKICITLSVMLMHACHCIHTLLQISFLTFLKLCTKDIAIGDETMLTVFMLIQCTCVHYWVYLYDPGLSDKGWFHKFESSHTSESSHNYVCLLFSS